MYFLGHTQFAQTHITNTVSHMSIMLYVQVLYFLARVRPFYATGVMGQAESCVHQRHAEWPVQRGVSGYIRCGIARGPSDMWKSCCSEHSYFRKYSCDKSIHA